MFPPAPSMENVIKSKRPSLSSFTSLRLQLWRKFHFLHPVPICMLMALEPICPNCEMLLWRFSTQVMPLWTFVELFCCSTVVSSRLLCLWVCLDSFFSSFVAHPGNSIKSNKRWSSATIQPLLILSTATNKKMIISHLLKTSTKAPLLIEANLSSEALLSLTLPHLK